MKKLDVAIKVGVFVVGIGLAVFGIMNLDQGSDAAAPTKAAQTEPDGTTTSTQMFTAIGEHQPAVTLGRGWVVRCVIIDGATRTIEPSYEAECAKPIKRPKAAKRPKPTLALGDLTGGGPNIGFTFDPGILVPAPKSVIPDDLVWFPDRSESAGRAVPGTAADADATTCDKVTGLCQWKKDSVQALPTPSDPVDVPPVKVVGPPIGCTYNVNPGQIVATLCVSEPHVSYTCADESRFLMTAVDGTRHCIRIGERPTAENHADLPKPVGRDGETKQ